MWDIIIDRPNAKNPHEYYPFSNGSEFQAVMSGDGQWKLHLPHTYRTVVKGGHGGQPGEYEYVEMDTALFDLVHDPCEKQNVLEAYPEVADTLLRYAKQHREKFYENDDLSN